MSDPSPSEKSLPQALEDLNELFDAVSVSDFPKPKQIIEIKSTSTLKEAAEILIKNNILSAPVYDASVTSDNWLEKYIGLIDLNDILSFVLAQLGEKEHSHATFMALTAKEEKIASATVAKIIAGRSTANPFIPIETGTSLRIALSLLGKHHIHRLPVIDVEKQQLVNIITQSAILKVFSAKLSVIEPITKRTLKDLGLGESKKLHTVSINDSARTAFSLITTHRIGAVPVVGVDNTLVANISARDMRAILSSSTLFEHLVKPLSTFLPILNEDRDDIMNPAICCEATATLGLVIQKLTVSNIHRIYVVDKKNRLISAISLTDILASFVTEPKSFSTES